MVKGHGLIAGDGGRPRWREGGFAGSWPADSRVCCTLERSAGAKVAELADAPDLGSGSRKAMGVRLAPFAPPTSRSSGCERDGFAARRSPAGAEAGALRFR